MVTSDSTFDGGLRIRLLGGLELRRSGTLLQLPASRRTRALLGFLVATGSPHSRSSLCDLLWDGPDDPRASLRWSLTKLRAVVDGRDGTRLLADRDKVAFDARGCEVDAQRVAAALDRNAPQAMALADLEALALLLRGEFLDGLDLPACYRFHHWCVSCREHYGAMRRKVLAALTGRLAAEPERALPYGHAMVEADPLAEAAHATLVRLLAAAGRYPEAERHYDWARDLLRREVAIPAGGPLDDAIHRVRRELRAGGGGDTAPLGPVTATTTPADGSPGSGTGQRLLGRDRESAAISEAVAGGPQPRLLLFAGAPGIGKTCLLDRLGAAASAAGHEVIRGRCFEAEMVRPYGLWLDALRGVTTSGIDPPVLAQAAPLLAGRSPEDGSRERLFDAAMALLRGLASRRPIALTLDDLQWIDEGSAALLHFLARHLVGRSGIVFACAARAGEIDDNVRARALLQSLAREELVRRFDLAPLSLAAARTLVASQSLDAEHAWRLSGGNPLYLRELARATGRGDSAGESLDDLIRSHLRSLDDDARELLAWAAAAGKEVRPALLAEAAGLPMGEVLARLHRLERHGLLAASDASGHVDFAHDLVRQTLYRSLSQARRQAIHSQYLRALRLESAADDARHGEIVHHAELAGDDLVAAQACLAAGQHCLRLFANPQAADVAERGLGHLAALAPGVQRVALEIALLRLRVAAAAGPVGRRLPALAERIRRAIAEAEELGLREDAASGWEILAYLRQWSSDGGDPREATLTAERMTRRGDARTHCIQLANSGRCLLDIEADMERGRELLAEAATQAAALGLEVMEVDWGRALIARADGHLDAARESLAVAVALARRAANHWREFECMVWLATVELEQGRHLDVLRHVGEIVSAAARMGEPAPPFAQALQALAWLRRDGARDLAAGGASAEEDLLASLAALRDLDDKAHLAYALNETAALAQEAGRRGDAARLAAEALTAARAVRRATEMTVAAARLVSACAWGVDGVDAPLVAQARRLLEDWPRSWPATGSPTARAVAAMATATAAIASAAVASSDAPVIEGAAVGGAAGAAAGALSATIARTPRRQAGVPARCSLADGDHRVPNRR